MGVDAGKVKQKAEEEAQRAAQRQAGSVSYWNPEGGKNKIRFMPPWKNCTHGGSGKCQLPECRTADQFWREIYVHWGIGADGNDENGQFFPCPTRTPFAPKVSSCPICIEVTRLRGTGDPTDSEIANDIRAKQRYYSNIVNLDDPVLTSKDVEEWKAKQEDKTRECPFAAGDTKIQVFSYGQMIYKDLLDIFGEQDISDLANGRDVEIVREGVKRETKYRTRAVFNQSPFSYRGTMPLEQATVNLDALMPFVPPEDMQKALNGEKVDHRGGGNGQAQVPAGKPAPQLPPASTQQQARPAAQPAQQPKPLPQAAQEPVGEAPPCHLDLKTVNPKDAECVGGQKGQDIYDPCPFFKSCLDAQEASLRPAAPPSRRQAAKRTPTVPDTSAPQSVNELEQEMRRSLDRQS